MNELTPHFWDVFFEVFEALPRQGPGNRACAARALGLCRDLPPSPTVLDMGCGVGGLRSVRTVCVSPFPEDQGRVLYFGGFDAAQGPHRDTAWIYKGTLEDKP
jgi:hypothetical protein